jgi:predicted O-linked N-acetylglucosamine transferase (SPINDLY family)
MYKILFFLFLCAPLFAQSDYFEQLESKYDFFMNDAQFEQAILVANEMKEWALQNEGKRSKKYLSSLQKLSETYMNKEDYVNAVFYFRTLLALEPENQEALINLGASVIYWGELKLSEVNDETDLQAIYPEILNMFSDGVNAFEKLKILNPKNPYLKDNLVAAYRIRGKFYGQNLQKIVEATSDLEKSNLYAEEKDVEVLRLLGVAYGFSGVLAVDNPKLSKEYNLKAIDVLHKALEIAPDYVPSIYNLEIAYRELAKKDTKNKEKYLAKADELNKQWKKLDPDYSPN